MSNVNEIFLQLNVLYEKSKAIQFTTNKNMLPVKKALSGVRTRVNINMTVPVSSLSDFINLKKGKILKYKIDKGIEVSFDV